MDFDYDIAMQNLKDSSEKVGRIHTSVSELQNTMRGKAADFYYKLALLSGGVLSLSITFIGFLVSLPNPKLNFAEFLFLGWIALLVTLFSSIYRNHFNLDMGHYQTLIVLNNARLEELKASLVVLENYPKSFKNLKTQDDIDNQIKITKHNISTIEKAIKEVKKKENKNSLFWQITQKSAHICFFLGMVSITIFASLNLPIPLSFNILVLFKK